MNRLKVLIIGLVSIICLLTIIDFTLFSTKHTEVIINTSTKHQSYYNAGGNSHVSYTLNTKTNSFSITKEFNSLIKKGDTITYTTSLFFNKVNSYSTNKSNKETYSLRWLSGLILPLITLLTFIVFIATKKDNDILFFVLSLITIANLIHLLC